MGENTSTDFIVVSVPMPREVYIQFSLAVLRREGPKKKTKVLVDLVERYVNETMQNEGQKEPSSALQAAISSTTEGDEPS